MNGVVEVSNLIEKMDLGTQTARRAAPTLLKEKGYSRLTDKHRSRCLTSSTLDKLRVRVWGNF